MEALRMIRDVSPSRSLVLIRFRSKEAAEDFIGEFDGRLFNSFEVSLVLVSVFGGRREGTEGERSELASFLRSPRRVGLLRFSSF